MVALYVLVVLLIAGSTASPTEDDVFGPEEFADEEVEDSVMMNPSMFLGHRYNHDISRGKVAFSVLLTHGMENAGKEQHLRFDKVLLNDGEAYDTLDGIFRAPKCGVYSFTFSVAADQGKFVKAYLKVQGSAVDGAVATANHCRYCSKGNHAQGSNTAIVHMHKGQKAWIELDRGSTTYDATDAIYNSFSGFLLYTRE